jgi:hypothetical protein
MANVRWKKAAAIAIAFWDIAHLFLCKARDDLEEELAATHQAQAKIELPIKEDLAHSCTTHIHGFLLRPRSQSELVHNSAFPRLFHHFCSPGIGPSRAHSWIRAGATLTYRKSPIVSLHMDNLDQ